MCCWDPEEYCPSARTYVICAATALSDTVMRRLRRASQLSDGAKQWAFPSRHFLRLAA
jgi:hypothetical protein